MGGAAALCYFCLSAHPSLFFHSPGIFPGWEEPGVQDLRHTAVAGNEGCLPPCCGVSIVPGWAAVSWPKAARLPLLPARSRSGACCPASAPTPRTCWGPSKGWHAPWAWPSASARTSAPPCARPCAPSSTGAARQVGGSAGVPGGPVPCSDPLRAGVGADGPTDPRRPLSFSPQTRSEQKWVALPKTSCPSSSTCTASPRRRAAAARSAAPCWTPCVPT